MNISQLAQEIRRAGKDAHYWVRARPQPDALPDDVVILEPSVASPGKWVVYYTERGVVSPWGTFDTEQDACDYVLSLLRR